MVDTGASSNAYSDQLKDTDTVVTQCSDGSYCCGNNATSCCSNRQGVWVLNGTTTHVNPYAASTNTDSVTALKPTDEISFSTTITSN